MDGGHDVQNEDVQNDDLQNKEKRSACRQPFFAGLAIALRRFSTLSLIHIFMRVPRATVITSTWTAGG